MPSRRLSIFAAISLAVLLLLLCGYVISLELIPYHATFSSQIEVEDCELKLEGGLCVVEVNLFSLPPSSVAHVHPGFHVLPLLNLTPARSISLWRYGVGRTNYGIGGNGFYLVCPIWSLSIPCTIAPLLWLRRRRQKESRGFAVEPATLSLPDSKRGLN